MTKKKKKTKKKVTARKRKFSKNELVTVVSSGYVVRDGELCRPLAHIVGVSKDNTRYQVRYKVSPLSWWAKESELEKYEGD